MSYDLDFDTDRFQVADDGTVTYIGEGEDYEALESQGYRYELDVHVIENGVDLRGRPMITGRAMATVFVDILNIPEVPDPPQAPVMSRISRTGAWCQWEEPHYAAQGAERPTKYVFQLADGDGELLREFTLTAEEAGEAEFRQALTGLTPETAYRLRLRAENGVGTSEWSAPAAFETHPVNLPPTVANPPADREYRIAHVNGQYQYRNERVELAGIFDDPEGREMTVEASSGNTGVASIAGDGVHEDNGTLSILVKSPGTAVITLTATDEDPLRDPDAIEPGKTVTTTFTVTVVAE